MIFNWSYRLCFIPTPGSGLMSSYIYIYISIYHIYHQYIYISIYLISWMISGNPVISTYFPKYTNAMKSRKPLLSRTAHTLPFLHLQVWKVDLLSRGLAVRQNTWASFSIRFSSHLFPNSKATSKMIGIFCQKSQGKTMVTSIYSAVMLLAYTLLVTKTPRSYTVPFYKLFRHRSCRICSEE